MDLPKIALANFPDTHVAVIVILFCTLLANHFLLDEYCVRDTEFQKMWKLLSEADHRAMQEMEAVMSVCFEYSTNESQNSNAFNSSLLPWYHKALLKSSKKTEYKVLSITRQPGRTLLKKWPRETRKVCILFYIHVHCISIITYHLPRLYYFAVKDSRFPGRWKEMSD